MARTSGGQMTSAQYEELHQMIQGDHDALTRAVTQLEAAIETINKVSEAVNGNGQPGLKTRMKVVEDRLAVISRVLALVFTPVVASLVAAVINLLTGGSK